MNKSDRDQRNKAETFGDLILAAMNDAAVNRKLSQLKITLQPEGQTKPSLVRIIIVPETMDMEFPQGLMKKESKNV